MAQGPSLLEPRHVADFPHRWIDDMMQGTRNCWSERSATSASVRSRALESIAISSRDCMFKMPGGPIRLYDAADRCSSAWCCPAPPGSLYGNRVTALRWAGILRSLGHRVIITGDYQDERCDLLIALHARKSAGAASRFRARHAVSPLVVALTGTDVYHDLARYRVAPGARSRGPDRGAPAAGRSGSSSRIYAGRYM